MIAYEFIIDCMSVYPVYFEPLLPPLLRVAAWFFGLLLVTWCGVVWCGAVWCGVVWCGVVFFDSAS